MKTNKKICFFCGDLDLSGGTERMTILVANALNRRGYFVSVISLSGGMNPFFSLDESINIYQLNKYRKSFSQPTNYFSTIKRLRHILVREKIDVCIHVESILALFALPASIGLSLVNITWEHFNFLINLGQKKRTFARYLARLFSDKIITLTARDQEMWLEKAKRKSRSNTYL